METDEELLVAINDLMPKYREANQRVSKAMQALRAAQGRGRAHLQRHEEVNIQTWDCENANKIVELTVELAKHYDQIGRAMADQAVIVSQLNSKVKLIKERLGHGKADQ